MKKLLVIIPLILLSYIVSSQPCPSINSFSVTPPSCFGFVNGIIEINYAGGMAPYTLTLIGPVSYSFVTSVLTQSVTNISAGSYSVTITDNNGCSTSQFVNVPQPNQLSLFASPNTTICYGQSTLIAAAGQGGSPSYSYSWNPSSLIGGGPFTVTPTSSTNYTVWLTDAKGCTVAPKIITVDVTPSLTVAGSSIAICDGAPTILTPFISSPGNGGPYSYNWSNSANTETISVLGNASSSPTTYTVYASDGCTIPQASAVFTVVTNICTGINELNGSSLSIFPNPTIGYLIISDLNIIHKIEITDLSGQVLFSDKIIDHSYQMQLQDFAEGIYILKVIYGNGMISTKKISITR